jgi:hypothetical protein
MVSRDIYNPWYSWFPREIKCCFIWDINSVLLFMFPWEIKSCYSSFPCDVSSLVLLMVSVGYKEVIYTDQRLSMLDQMRVSHT